MIILKSTTFVYFDALAYIVPVAGPAWLIPARFSPTSSLHPFPYLCHYILLIHTLKHAYEHTCELDHLRKSLTSVRHVHT